MAQAQNMPSSASAVVELDTGLPTRVWYFFWRNLWLRTGAGGGASQLFAGCMMPFGGATIPAGWLLCDGSAVSRTSYATLFATIGTTWGTGDGVTTFNLPDMRDRFGIGASGTNPLGTYGGSASVTLTVGQLPAHSHAITDPGHSHTAAVTASNGTSGAAAVGATSGNTGTATTGITVQNTGSGDPVDITPPFAALNWIISVGGS